MATRMLQRRATAAEWAAENPVLASGEIGFETDTKVIKLGDGVTPWADLTLPYAEKTYVDAQRDTRVAKAGDTMTGGLVMNEQRITRPELFAYQEHEEASSTSTLTVDFFTAQLHSTSYSGALTVAWANLPAAGKVRVATLFIPSTVTGITWPAGTKHPDGVLPALDGETWISVVARGTTVTAGVAWSGVL